MSRSTLSAVAAITALAGATASQSQPIIMECPRFRRDDGSYLLLESEPDGFQPCIYGFDGQLLMAWPNVEPTLTTAYSTYTRSNPGDYTPLNISARLVLENLNVDPPSFLTNTPLLKGEVALDNINNPTLPDASVTFPTPTPAEPTAAAQVTDPDPAPRSASTEQPAPTPIPSKREPVAEDAMLKAAITVIDQAGELILEAYRALGAGGYYFAAAKCLASMAEIMTAKGLIENEMVDYDDLDELLGTEDASASGND